MSVPIILLIIAISVLLILLVVGLFYLRKRNKANSQVHNFEGGTIVKQEAFPQNSPITSHRVESSRMISERAPKSNTKCDDSYLSDHSFLQKKDETPKFNRSNYSDVAIRISLNEKDMKEIEENKIIRVSRNYDEVR
jgi:hypothetical protein